MSNNKNKFTKLNINNEFKGKSAEIQQKTTIRPNQTGLQTLGKAVSARRMPKPANLPSLRSETSTSIPTTTTTSTSQQQSQTQQQQQQQQQQISINSTASSTSTNTLAVNQQTHDDLNDDVNKNGTARQTWSNTNNFKTNSIISNTNSLNVIKKKRS
jgi:hypothetical protein